MRILTHGVGRLSSLVAVGLLLLLAAGCRRANREVAERRDADDSNHGADLTQWPWSGAQEEPVWSGVTHVSASGRSSVTGDLLCFNFGLNPALELRLYDQDQHDASPGDDRVYEWWRTGVGQVAQRLIDEDRGKVLAVWNGSFYGIAQPADGAPFAHHVAPIVTEGRVSYNVGSPRWSFGFAEGAEGPRFETLRSPTAEALRRAYTCGIGGVQCLVRQGAPLRLDTSGPDTSEDDLGAIPANDRRRTSRTSLGWSKDSRRLFVLVVSGEGHGWTVPDLQRFWLSLGVWGAVNLDGGRSTQLTLRQPKDAYLLLAAAADNGALRQTVPSTFADASASGVLNCFYVRDTRR